MYWNEWCHEKGFRCGFDPKPKHCGFHGAALRKGRPWFELKTPGRVGPSEGLNILPTPAARWAAVLRAALESAPERMPWRPSPWFEQVRKALDVDFTERGAE